MSEVKTAAVDTFSVMNFRNSLDNLPNSRCTKQVLECVFLWLPGSILYPGQKLGEIESVTRNDYPGNRADKVVAAKKLPDNIVTEGTRVSSQC